MKKMLCVFLSLFLLNSCYKDDINGLRDDISKLKERMAQYENLLDALNKRLYVVSYETKDGSYVITLSDGSKLSVRNTSAFITIGENGNWWIDGADSGHPAKGDTPQIAIGGNGHWWINGEDTGVSAKGQSGKDASEIVSISLVNGMMTFTFADGRTISIEAAAPEITLDEPAGGFVLDNMKWLRIHPQVKNTSGATYQWLLDGEEIAGTQELLHAFAVAGTYTLTFKAKNGVGENVKTTTVTVNDRTYNNWVNRVYDFVRAPGQFANSYPAISDGDDAAAVLLKINTTITGKGLVSLGGYGGYIVMGFDHTVINKPGVNDFTVMGNAFANWAEPGVIEISYDANGNGLPDDPWYEIAGSEYYKETALHHYQMTYYNPMMDTERAEGATGTRWTDNKGNAGYVPTANWPKWLGATITVGGSRYKENMNTSGIVTTVPFEFGYADNWPNTDSRAGINIDWAVDASGIPVKLRGIDFIKVYTAVSAYGGAVGEISTEITGAQDLHL